MTKKTKIILWVVSAITLIIIVYLVYRQIKLQNSYNSKVDAASLATAINSPDLVIDLSTDADVDAISGMVNSDDTNNSLTFGNVSTADLQNELNNGDIIF